MRTAYITHPDCKRHEMIPGHPEAPSRLDAIHQRLEAEGLLERVSRYEAPLASEDQLCLAHDPRHVANIHAIAPREGLVQIDPDTAMNPHSLTAALRAAGAAVLATDLVAGGSADRAFCSVRPPGHHAERARAMGFCLFNNVAVGVAHALAHHGMERVAIVDFDVHHGNGTEDIFRNESRVLMCSTYQYPLYPHVRGAVEPGHMVNVALAPGAGGADLRRAVEAHWLPELERFRPQLVFVSAGFDAHRDDPLAGLAFTEADYTWVTEVLLRTTAASAEGRLISTLEGGYALDALGRSVAAHLRVLVDA